MIPNLHLWPDRFLFSFNTVAWSLFLEMLANIIYAALVRGRLAVTWLLFLAVLLPAGLIVYWAHRGYSLDIGFDNSPQSLLLGIARVTLSFSMGVLLLRLYNLAPRPRFALRGWFVTVLLPCLLAAMLLSPLHSMRTPIFRLLTIIVFLPALVLFGSFVSVPRSCIPVCVFLGDISYPIYMVHEPFLSFLQWKPIDHLIAQHILAGRLFIPVFFGSMLLLAYLVFHYYDEPIRRWFLAGQRR